MSGFTPGPWGIYSDEGEVCCDAPGIESVTGASIVVFGDLDSDFQGVRGDTAEEALANASLIAAAPDLLAALEELLKVRSGRTVKAARAAIAKARGAA